MAVLSHLLWPEKLSIYLLESSVWLALPAVIAIRSGFAALQTWTELYTGINFPEAAVNAFADPCKLLQIYKPQKSIIWREHAYYQVQRHKVARDAGRGLPNAASGCLQWQR